MSSLIDNLARHLPKPPVAPTKPNAGISHLARRERIALPRWNIPSIDAKPEDIAPIKHTILTVWSGSRPLIVPVGTLWHDEREGVVIVKTHNGWLALR